MCWGTLLMTGMNLAGAAMTASGAQSAMGGAYKQAVYQRHNAEIDHMFSMAQLDIQDEQLRSEAENIRIRATQQMTQRMAEANRIHTANMVHIAGSGVGENLSYEQGVREANQRELGSDINAIMMDGAQQGLRLADQIRVNSIERIFSRERASTIGNLAMVNAHYQAKSYQTQAATSIMQNFALPSLQSLSSGGQRGGGLLRLPSGLMGG